jgi:ribose 1,5-bisphosphokinase PhnN
MLEGIATSGTRHESMAILVSRLKPMRGRKDPSPVPLRLEKAPERDTLPSDVSPL